MRNNGFADEVDGFHKGNVIYWEWTTLRMYRRYRKSHIPEEGTGEKDEV